MLHISEALAKPTGTVIDGIQGQIEKVLKPKTGKTDLGPWSFQSIIIKDATGDCLLKLKNRPEVSSRDIGKLVSFESVPGKKGKTGVEVDEYNEKKQILVTDKAEMSFHESGEDAPQSSAKPPPRPPNQPAVSGERGARQQAMRAANAWDISLGASRYVMEKNGMWIDDPNQPHNSSITRRLHVQIADQIYANLAFAHCIDSLPASPIKGEEKPDLRAEVRAKLEAEGITDDVFFPLAQEQGWIRPTAKDWSAVNEAEAKYLSEHFATVLHECHKASPEQPY